MNYHTKTKSLAFSLIFILPLLAIYEVWLIQTEPSVVNAAGDLARLPLEYLSLIIRRFGETNMLTGAVLLNVLFIVLCLIALIKFRKDGIPGPSYFVVTLLESILYGLLLTQAATLPSYFTTPESTQTLAMSGVPQSKLDLIMLSVGAGVYEEIMFRLLVVGGLFFLGKFIFEHRKLNLAIILLVSVTLVGAFLKQLALPGEVQGVKGFIKGFILDAPLFAGIGLLILSFHCALIWLLIKVKVKPVWAAAAVSVVIGSLLFAAFHHLGPMGEPLVAYVFFFRFMAGLLLSIIFQFRGLGIAVYTHAAYDVIVVLAA